MYHVKTYENFLNEEWSLKKKKKLDAACWWMMDGTLVKISINKNGNTMHAYAGVSGFQSFDRHYFKPCSKEDNRKLQSILKSKIYEVSNIDDEYVYFKRRDGKITLIEYEIISEKPYYIDDVKNIKLK
jgi:hypothetical protein